MERDFRTALLSHMEEHQTSIAELVSATGVSRDVINKLKGRAPSSTNVENAILIAAFYGKTVNEFIAGRKATAASRTRALLDLLSEEEVQLVEAQTRGLVLNRQTTE